MRAQAWKALSSASVEQYALLKEARAAVRTQEETLLPPTPDPTRRLSFASDPAADGGEQGGEEDCGEDGGEDGAAGSSGGGEEEEEAVQCEGCENPMVEEGVDYHFDMEGHAWCNHCNFRVDELEA